MRSLAGSSADGVLADAILIPPRPEGKGSAKKMRKLHKQHLLVNEKRRCRDG